VVYHLPVVFLGYAVHFHRVRLIDEIEQERKRVAEIETAPTAVTDVVDPFEFFEQGLVIVEFVRSPIQWVACRSLEAALAS
jgi:hypothetical protein